MRVVRILISQRIASHTWTKWGRNLESPTYWCHCSALAGWFQKRTDELTKYLSEQRNGVLYWKRLFLKTSLMLIDSDVRSKVKNFTSEEVGKIQQQWSEIKLCIKETFNFIRRSWHQSNVWYLKCSHSCGLLASKANQRTCIIYND